MTAPTPTHGGFEIAELQHVLDRACSAVGLDAAGAQLLRGHTNAVVRLANAPVVIKVARRGSKFENVQRTVAFVRWIMDRGFPTVPLHPVADQPLAISGHAVTYWTYLPQPERNVSAAQIAKPLFALHSLPTPPLDLPVLDNLTAIRASLRRITALPEATKQFLSERADHLEQALSTIDFVLPRAVLQGDPQHRNALLDGTDTVLCDWDTVAVGQPEWDLVTLEIHCRRFGYSRDHYKQFANTYGFDVTRWPGFPVLRDIRELRMITTNARKISHAPSSAAEIDRRIAGLRCEDSSLAWNIL
ncbi:phosphotransferase family protein [Streptomyces celluloflavus]|uniref:phosphotransferase family protein n=1 Tax=Streptomyces celluloflavus TaxID=58344 RepID=UPI0036B87E12